MPRARRRARLLVIAAAVAGAASVAAAVAYSRSGSGGAGPPVATAGATYTEAVIGTWQRVNPLVAATDVDRDLVQLVFSGLVRLGPDGSIAPALADVPEASENGRQLSFRLRTGLRWSDGAPLTSADVAFTIGLLKAPDFRGDPLLAEAWASVEVDTPDAGTVTLRLPEANAPFVARFATIGILPKHLLEGTTGQDLLVHRFNGQPVGAGPYTIRSLSSQEARLTPNPYYHGTEPAIGTLRLRFYADQASALRGFLARDVDGYLARQPVSGEELAAVAEARPANILSVSRSTALVLYLNNDLTLFEDEVVRRAVALAIDRATLPVNAGRPDPALTGSPIIPGSWAYAAAFDRYDEALGEARRLLGEAGWQPHPTTGVLSREGSEFRFTIRTDEDPVRLAVAAEVASQLQRLGVRATVVSTPFTVLLRDFLQDRKYEAAVVAWDQGPDPDLYDGWHSSQMGSAGLNLANFADPVTDELIAFGRTRYETRVRLEAYRQIQDRWQEMMPSVVLGYSSLTYLLAEDVEPTVPTVLYTLASRWSRIEDWKR